MATHGVSDLKPARILIVDDVCAIHEDFRKILQSPDRDDGLQAVEAILFGEAAPDRQCAPGFCLDFALQGQEALVLVQQAVKESRPFSVVFVDMRMPPGWDGVETIEHLWNADAELQIVICSAHSDYDWTDLLARLGRSDKLLVVKKPFERIEVLQCAYALTAKWRNERALRRQLDSLEKDVTDRTEGLEAANKQLRHLATHDSLTSLPNRVLLDDRLSQAMVHAERAGERFALFVLDLDRFKLVNDSLGHRAGDEVLRQVARRLTAAVRSVDSVARLGGDEFVLIISQANGSDDAQRVALTIIEALQPPIKIEELEVHASVSIGVAFYPRDGTTIETLYSHADAAMYCAKQRGGSNVQCFSPSMNLVTESRIKFEGDLHHALKLQQFELHYQPKVLATTGQMHGAEALIRWRHPELGLLPPDQFVPLAEESGLIIPIGEWVLRQVCLQVKAWQSAGLPPVRIAVNISAVQFQQRDLVDTVRCALDDAGIDARYLEVELTESAVMSNPEESIEILEKLSRMGVVISVDDFGTGYSSMSYLRRFPIDKLKIDRSFINDVTTSAVDTSIVSAIISLAHSLRLRVVAEGVETAEQAALLAKLGCDQYQGFHFGRPIPAAAFEQLMRDEKAAATVWIDDEADRTQSRLGICQPAAGAK
jgi:diguanylate cyclase (GGDEF)-like protein